MSITTYPAIVAFRNDWITETGAPASFHPNWLAFIVLVNISRRFPPCREVTILTTNCDGGHRLVW